MHNNIRLFYDQAIRLGLAVSYFPDLDCLQIKLKKNYLFYCDFTPYNNASSMYLAKNKYFFNNLLYKKGFPVSKSFSVFKKYYSKTRLETLIQSMQFPLILKPGLDQFKDEDVIRNIKDFSSLCEHIEEALKVHSGIQIEESYPELKEYRLLIFKKRILGIVQRTPPMIYGNGKHTVEELIYAYHQNAANYNPSNPLIIDEDCMRCLNAQALALSSIAESAEPIYLSFSVNPEHGAKVVALPEKIPAYNKKQLKRLVKTSGLDLVGLDILCEDIQKSFKKTQWIVLQANIAPDISMHALPGAANKRCVSAKILRNLIRRHPLTYLMHRLKSSQRPGRMH